MISHTLFPRGCTRALLASLALVAFVALSGCGGSNGTDHPPVATPTPTPTPTRAGQGDGRGGALSDGVCGAAGTVVAQPGWADGCRIPVQPTRTWTVLLYMNGANDLETYGLQNLNQLETVGSDSNVTFVAQFKRGNASITGHDSSDGNWGGARRYVIRRDTDANHIASPVVSSRAAIDAGDPQSLKDFIVWGTQTFPAQHYAIVLWNHGAGWRAQTVKGAAKSRGFSYDDLYHSHIDTTQLPDALDLGGGRKWDLIAWDSSLMQMIEVAYEIRNQTNFIVGGEESPPGTGYPYDQWAKTFALNPQMDAPTLGAVISDSMLASYTTDSNITQSVLDASKIAPLVGAVNDFGGVLLAAQGTQSANIAKARGLSEYYGAGEGYDPNKDLYDFARLVKQYVPDAAVQASATRVQTAFNAAVLKNVHANQHPNSNGIAIYIPSLSVYQSDDIDQANGFGQRYSTLSFSKAAPNWQSFLTQAGQ